MIEKAFNCKTDAETMDSSLVQRREGQGVPRSRDASGLRLTHPKNWQGLPRQGRAWLKKRVQDIRIGTLNIGTMTGRSREVADVMERRKIDVLCVQETLWKGNKAREIGSGYKLIYSGTDERGRCGVGVVLSKEMKDNVIEVERISCRVMKVKLCCGGHMLNIISAYAPQVGCEEEVKVRFWRDMDETITSVELEERLFIGGDLNGHIGSSRENISRIHGGHGMGEMNEEGDRIIDFALAFDMAIINTFFTSRNYATYSSGGRETQIDFMLCRRNHLVEIKNCKVIKGETVSPQHRLVVSDVLIRRVAQGKKMVQPKIKWWRLKDQEIRERFKQAVLNSIRLAEDVNIWWVENSAMIIRTAEELLGKTSGRGPPNDKESWWWNQDTQDKIKRKREAGIAYKRNETVENKLAWKSAKKEAKKTVAVAKAKGMDELYEKLETPDGQKIIYKMAKSRNRATKDLTHIKQIKDRNGRVLSKEECIRARWKEYFEKLLNEENPRRIVEEGTPLTREVPAITREEVKRALDRMKNGKSVGPDGIPVEVWKVLGREGVDILWDLFTKIFKQERMPDSWRNSTMIPIYKGKGDVQDCTNYRGIKLISHTMKIYERIIEQRIRNETTMSEEQFGFMPGKGTVDAIFALRQTMEKYAERQKELHLVFIDLEKAYDRVPRQEVWRCMREKGVSEKYVKVVKDMYAGVTTQVRSTTGTTEKFNVRVGLHQGSTLSPYIFDLVMDVITSEVREGVPWSMMFADDVVLVDMTREGVERKLEMWRRALEDRGLRISRVKTEYMWMGGEGKQGEVKLGSDNIKRVTSFKYLGSSVMEDGGMDTEINHRIQSAWMNWRRSSGILCDKRISAKVKGRFYKSVVRPAMVYGAETWAVKKAQERKLEVAEMRMLRWMGGVTRRDRIRNDYIRGTVKVVEVSKKIQQKRLQWYGHVMRREDDHACRRVMDMEVEGRRRRGRPKFRWKDNIANDMREKGLREQDVLDRRSWRRLIRNSDPI